MVRRYSWEYRRVHFIEFPIVCKTCLPIEELRFKRERDLELHNNMTSKHLPGYVPKERNKRRNRRSKGTRINKFIDEQILIDDSYRTACNHIVKKIGNILKNNVLEMYRPAEVIKAGSTGKGTAIKGSSDVDIVFLLGGNFKEVEQLEEERDNILNDISSTLRDQQYNVIGKSSKAVQVRCHELVTGTIDVDILPAINLDDYDKNAISAKMESSDPTVRKLFPPSLTKWQRDFVKYCPEKLKRLIRYVKNWKDTALKNSPPSYAMELLVIHLWHQASRPNDFHFESALGLVMEKLSSSSTIRIEFDEFYDSQHKQRHDTPYIIDPVSPYSNVMQKYDSWGEVENRAHEFLKREILRGIQFGFKPNPY